MSSTYTVQLTYTGMSSTYTVQLTDTGMSHLTLYS